MDPIEVIHNALAGCSEEHAAGDLAQRVMSALGASGLAVVPVTPTEQQQKAGIDASPMWLVDRGPEGAQMLVLGRERQSFSTGEAAEVYRAMISAAPGRAA